MTINVSFGNDTVTRHCECSGSGMKQSICVYEIASGYYYLKLKVTVDTLPRNDSLSGLMKQSFCVYEIASGYYYLKLKVTVDILPRNDGLSGLMKQSFCLC